MGLPLRALAAGKGFQVVGVGFEDVPEPGTQRSCIVLADIRKFEHSCELFMCFLERGTAVVFLISIHDTNLP